MDQERMPEVEGSLVKLAIQTSADAVRAALADHPLAAPKEFVVPLHGLPGYSIAEVQAARRLDGTIRVAVQGLDGMTLDQPVITDFEAGSLPLEVDDGSVEGRNGSRWVPASGHIEQELIGMDDVGMAITKNVDSSKYPWKLLCACGNVRYAKRSSIRQVDRCRPCSDRRRHQYQVAWQRKKRAAAKSIESL